MDNVTSNHSQTQTHANNLGEAPSWAQFILFPEYQTAMLVWKLWPPCILLLGLLGNLATILVMARVKDQHSAQRVILIALAVCDLCILGAGTFRDWLMFVFGVNVYRIPLVPCKLHALLMYSARSLSAWLLTCVTVQRAMAVTWPHRIRALWTMRRTWIVIAALVFTACALHADKLVGMEITSRNECAYVLEGYKLFETIWHWLDLVATSILPSLCLLVCDVILSTTLFKAVSATSLTAQAVSGASATTTPTHSNTDRKKTASRTTVMILVLSSTFLLLTLPLCVLILWYDFVQVTYFTRFYARFQLGRTVSVNLWYTNSAVNFLLYCLTGTKFRTEFFRLLRCRPTAAPSQAAGEDSRKSG